MNKTVSINLGGILFHIDEDAYLKLSHYLEAVKRYLSNSDGQEEIMIDIEVRISELLSENRDSDKQVVSDKNIDKIIRIMGQPEDYKLDDSSVSDTKEPLDHTLKRSVKKLYRDPDKGIIGGVAAGFGHYLRIDSLWLRILLIILFFAGFGSGIIAYIVLWLITPAAKTTSEKLEMTGDPINISNIEKKVRENFNNVSNKIKNTDYDKLKKSTETNVEKGIAALIKIITFILTFFLKCIGILLVIISVFVLICLLINIFIFESTKFIYISWKEYIHLMNYAEVPMWAITLLCFLAMGIPFFFLFILGLKLVINNTKSIGNTAKYTLMAVWLISILLLITFGIKQLI